jgi:hypothetical protein
MDTGNARDADTERPRLQLIEQILSLTELCEQLYVTAQAIYDLRSQLMDDLGAPQLTPQLAEALVAGVDEELAGTDVATLVGQRDALLVGLLTAKATAKALP